MAWKPLYASSAELAQYLRIPDGDVVDEDELVFAVTAAARAIDKAANRQFGKVGAPQARTYTNAQWDRDEGLWFYEIDDLTTVVGLTLAIGGQTLTDYELWPLNAAADLMPWTRLYIAAASTVSPSTSTDRLTATADWGWTNLPPTIKQATLLQASRFFVRRNAPFGVAGSPELGSELRLLAKVDPDVEVMVTPYKRRRKVG